MRPLRRFLRRLVSWATRARDEDRLREEIEEHMAQQAAEYVRAGMAPGEARRQAALKFGGVEAMREAWRDQRALPLLETLAQDTRHALRRLRMAPAFTVTTTLTLALGIGATTAIFTLAHAVLLKSLPVAKPGELYRLGKESRCCYWGGYSQDQEYSLVSYELYRHFRDNTPGFVELAAFSAPTLDFAVRRAGATEPSQTYPGEFVSGNYFAMFGVGAYSGRVLAPADDRPGGAVAAVMSYRLWEGRYGGDPSVIGTVFDFNGKPVTVVGIAPPGFFGDTLRSEPPDFYLPLNSEPLLQGDQDLVRVDNYWLDMIGRIRPGASAAAIEARMRVELKQWLQSHWADMTANDRARFPKQTLYLYPGGAGITSMRERYELWLRVLMMVSGFVLLIVCANVANLMLVRGMERRRQTSLSMALGARASRVMRQALTESLILSLTGGAAGLAIAFAGTRLILEFAFPVVAGRPGVPIDASPSMPVLLFALGVSLIAGIGFGIAPAWMATRVDPIEALRGSGRSTARVGLWPRNTLVVLQAALSLVVLSASGLLTEALRHLENQGFGFETERRIVVNIDPRLAGYRPAQLTPLYRRIQESVSNLPGVEAAALCIYSPFARNLWGSSIWVDGHPAPGPNEDNGAFWNRVTAGFFTTIGNPILRGRAITEADTQTSRRVAVINETFARKFFPGEDPLGKHFGQHGAESLREYEIVGIAGDARILPIKLDGPMLPFFFLPEAQHDSGPDAPGLDYNPGSHFLRDVVIETRPGVVLPYGQVRETLNAVDAGLPVRGIHTLQEQVAGQFTQQRLIARLTSFFGALSLVLAAIGLYGVTAYNAGRRVNEIGVRMALGAGRGDVVRLVVRGAARLIGLGVVLGLPLTVVVGRALASQLYGVSPYNLAVLAGAVGVLALSALVASFVPAFRASWISPMEALRVE